MIEMKKVIVYHSINSIFDKFKNTKEVGIRLMYYSSNKIGRIIKRQKNVL